MTAAQNVGQATVEYIFILAFAVFLGFKATNAFTGFFRDSVGGIGHTLSTNLTIGVCEQDCWFRGYENSFVSGQ